MKRGLVMLAVLLLASRAVPRGGVPPPFSFDAPAGPQFSAAGRHAQRTAGSGVVARVRAAFDAGADSVVLPPGDYRFGQERWGRDGPIFPLEFRGLRRPADRPFRIVAEGATFWFELPPDQTPRAHFALGFVDCSHVSIEGATLDRDPSGNLEGRITQIDEAGNRIEIEASKEAFVPAEFSGDLNQRLIPFNSDGTFCAALYALQHRPGRLQYRSVEPGTRSGRHWVNLDAHSGLLRTNRDPAWRRTYGDAGTLQPGDGLSLVYSTTAALSVRDCTAMGFLRVTNHVAKGMVRELGGVGGHLWKDCYFGPRPGTCQWQGADGILTGCMEQGSRYEGLTMLHTTDDLLDIHGFWGYVEKAEGRTVALQRDHAMPAVAGDRLHFFHRQTGAPLGGATVLAVTNHTLTLDRDAEALAEAVAENPGRQNNGWVIRNCTFVDCYQRLLVQGGNGGTLRDCRFERVGSCLQLHSNFFTKNEGGICRGISVLGNTFEDVAVHPGGATIEVGFQSLNHDARTPLLSDITVRGNTFVRSGRRAVEFSLVSGGDVSSNRFVDVGRAGALAGQPAEEEELGPVRLTRCVDVTVRDNLQADSADEPPSAARAAR